MNAEADSRLDEALALGVELEHYSHWPLGWHEIVLEALNRAAELGIRKLYVKEKMGGLRLQGGGKAYLQTKDALELRADRICAWCGEQCDKPHRVGDLPRCKAEHDAIAQWVSVPSADGCLNEAKQQK